MTDSTGGTNAALTPLQKALLTIKRLQTRVRRLEAERTGPVAVVGIGCRTPGGGRDADGFFSALLEGRDAVRPVPAVARPWWPAASEGSELPPAGYLEEDVSGFDAGFFGISPREAASIDPQHRILLECAWEALESAGIDPHSLHGARGGVFLGMAGNDYANVQLRSERAAQLLHSHFASGTGHSMASGRLSYLLGLHGPSITVDTACSSSLVAVHLACQSLRNGESDVAFAAGVNLILSMDYTSAFHRARMLSPDGRCKAFDAAADGFGRAEGCGVVVLKRLEDAQRDGDPILAVIRGSAVNQDGPSSGLTAPNGPAQEAVIRAALAQAQLRPVDIGYVEAHGTGTSLGDPIEAQALGNVFEEGRSADRPLLVGAVKSNLGHLEAAAGITGLIKVIEAVRRGLVPASLHFSTPNPHIPWEELPLAVPTEPTDFPTDGGKRRAGVSSFGFSGTNAHVIVEEPPASPPPPAAPDRVRLLALSAADPGALRARAEGMIRALDERDESFADVCYTAGAGRAHHEHRLAVRAAGSQEAVATLRGWLRGEETEGFLRAGRAARGDVPSIAFLFTGQGAQYAGMGWALRQHSPVFRRVLDECDEVLRELIEVPLSRLLDPTAAEAELVNRTDLTQPALFALQIGLAELWRSWGVRPALVLGHSIGEYAAACLAGVFTVPDALRVVAARGRLMHEVTAAGRMIALTADEEQVQRLVETAGVPVSIAALNAPGQVVVAGAADAVGDLESRAHSAGIEVKSLRTSHAFHSPLMDPVVPKMEAVLRSVTLRPAEQLRFVSSVTGAPIAPSELADPTYWARQIRLPVRFADAAAAAATLVQRGVEIGPHPTLSGLVAMGGSGLPVHRSLHREEDAWGTLTGTVAELYTAGVPIAWKELADGTAARVVDLPRYPFQRQTLWVDTGRVSGGRSRAGGGHPLLGARLPQPGDELHFESYLDAQTPAFIGEHRVLGSPILPGTAYLEMALAAAQTALGGSVELRDVQLLEPMDFSTGERVVHTRLDPAGGTFTIHSAPGDPEGGWALHCTGVVARSADGEAEVDVAAALVACDREIDGAEFSDSLAARGYEFGPRLRGIDAIRAGEGLAVGSVRLPEACADDDGSYHAHPLLLDAAVQTIGAALTGEASTRTWVPHLIGRVAVLAPLTGRARVHTRVDEVDARSLRATVTLLDDANVVTARLEGMRFGELSRAEADPFLEVQWVESEPDAAGRHALREDVDRVVEDSLRELAGREGAAAYDRVVEKLEALSAGYVRGAFVELGWQAQPGDVVHEGELAVQLGIAPAQRRLFGRMLAIAAEENVLEEAPERESWRVLAPLADRASSAASVSGNGGTPPAERVLLDRCGPRLGELLRGIGDPLELLFPAGAAADAERMYYDAPFARIFNTTIAEAVATAAAAKAGGQPLRVLEVGGGTAGTTRRILERIDAAGLRVEYTFTDISPAFLERGRERWADREDIEYRTFDLDREPLAQGFGAESYDVVVAANCLHAARDLGAALRRVRSLLRPGGMLAAVEVFGPHRWFDLTVGLTEGWWHFTDAALRRDYPCISAESWRALLHETGFGASQATPLSALNVASGYASRNQGVVIAYRAAEAAQATVAERWLLAGEGTLTTDVAARLERNGRTVVCTPLSGLPSAVRDGGEGWRGVVVCEAGFAGRSLVPEDVATAVRAGLEPLVALAAAVASGEARVERLFVATRGAQVATLADVDTDPSGATLWGLARTLELELPELPVHRLDLDATHQRDEATTIVEWLLDPPQEPELAWRFGMLHARRVAARRVGDSSFAGEYRLIPPERRSLDEVAFSVGERRTPGPGEVEVRVVASAMNFKDVLNVLGMYPGDPGPLGSECAGVITAVGAGVRLEVGTAVMAAAGQAYGRHVVADARMVAPKPASMTFAEAAGLPIAYLTAHFALTHLAHVGPGDRVLIHAAAGGVGLAAVAIAQRAGAEVLATAGSEWKRDLLRAAGVRHVFDSRSDSFLAAVMDVTGGEGVTVVLNSLADELIEPTFAAIAPRGRFLEIGKRGIWSPDRVAALGKDLEYHIIDWGETARQDPDLVGSLFAEVMAAAAGGELPALPVCSFPLDRVADAFRFMAQGRHAGKIVLAHPVLASADPIRISADGAYLITGGTGGLGLSTAEWLQEQGANALVLVSRGGVRSEDDGRVAALRERGATVTVVAADVGDPADIQRLVTELREAGVERVLGVIHSAGALVNRTLQQAAWDDFEQVLRAKVHGTTLLAEALARLSPEFFVCYSSIASIFGAPGQANHSAANAFEDSFAAAVWRLGLTGVSIAWGPWSETGAAASAAVLDRTRERGLNALSTREGLRWLGYALAHPAPQFVGASIVDPDALTSGRGRLLEQLRKRTAAPVSATRETRLAAAASRFLDEFESAPVDARRTLLLNRVRTRIRRVLGLPATTTLDASRPLGEIGLDSLLAVELRNVLAEDIEQRLPATLLFDHATPAALADHLLTLLAPPAVTVTPTTDRDGADGLLGALESLDDDDIDRLLAEKLKLS